MPNNSCTVILNGHGFYTSTKIINLGGSNINYNIIFPCGLKESISSAHHNLIIGTLALANPIAQRLSLIEGFMSTTSANRTAPVLLINDMHNSNGHSKTSTLINEHLLTNAPDVTKAHTLADFNQQLSASVQHPSKQFLGYEVRHIPNPNNVREILVNGTFYVEFDNMQVRQDVINSHSSNFHGSDVNILLSANNLLYIMPTSSTNSRVEFLLSDLISNILPKLKIVAIYHLANNSVDIVPTVFLDDNNDNTLQHKVLSTLPASSSNINDITFSSSGDVYHELTIAGDANIIWDACRDFVS